MSYLMERFNYIIAILLILLYCNLGPQTLFGDEKSDQAFFEQHIRPVLVEHCYTCHSNKSEKLKGGLLLDSKAGIARGGDSGDPVIVAGKIDSGLLIQALRHENGLDMPPDKKLSAEIIHKFETWIKQGAYDPRTSDSVEIKRADKSWWSLQPLSNPKIPEVKNSLPNWQTSPIDRFILSRLEEQNLKPNSPADPRILIRRMYYDVIGLPPAPEEVTKFILDYQENSEAAVERLVDKLLASPQYGEQWGRHWLDVIRFGESHGFERNVINDTAWPFRDYVINSLNEDKPFDQFIREHLAGDILGKDNPAIEIGSAFLVVGPYDDVGNQDKVAQANIRAATLDDIIIATGSAFLGLTVNCARCHHHKFDPVPTEDYYRLRAAFEGVQHGNRVVATRDQKQKYNQLVGPLNKQISELTTRRDALNKVINERALEIHKSHAWSRPKIDPQQTIETFFPVKAKYIKFVIEATTSPPQLITVNKKIKKRAGAGGRLTEFEVWTAEKTPRNVALNANGATASGERSAFAEDFPDAYGPQYCIDGKFGEQWFIGNPAELLITLKQPEIINKVIFSNAKGSGIMDKSQGETPCEYEIQTSLDGETWETVATSDDREPWSEAHALSRLRSLVITPDEEQEIQQLNSELNQRQQQLQAVPPLPVMWVGKHQEPSAPTTTHLGGDPMKPGAVVHPASLKVLDQVTPNYELPVDAPQEERRLALANWITSPQNPLTSRVLANRIWQYHFGTGIVDTPSDFGFLGSKPTHPELLDYLAKRLIHHQWKIKPLHREILLSQTYRQASTYRPDAASIDKDSRLLWRFPPRRLTAEEIRDTLLSVTGKLNLKPGGPGFRLYKFTQNNVCTYFPLDEHGPETYRRAVYHQNARASFVDYLSDYDLPDIAFAAPKRSITTSPLQALTMLNHQFTQKMAAALIERIQQQHPEINPQEFTNQAYQLLFQRSPDKDELKFSIKFIEEHGLSLYCRTLLNLNEVIYVE